MARSFSPFLKNQHMHSLKDYSMNLPEQEYHAYPAWSYSVIAKYAKDGFPAIATLHDPVAPTPSMEFGSLFDSVLTKGKKTLDDYVVVDFGVPDAEKKVLDALVNRTNVPFSEIPMTTFLEVADSVSYQMRLKPETRYEKVSKYSTYYDNIRSGKKIVSQKDWDDAVEMARIFREDPYLKTLFGVKNTKDVEYIYQAQFKVKGSVGGKEVELKIMPDLLVVNHAEGTIQPVDLKTSAMPAYDFAENFLKFRYDIQAELYTHVLGCVICNDTIYQNYEILPYLFTDISRSDKVPVTYEYEPRYGFSFTKNGRMYEYKGWQELLAEILDYEEKGAKVPSWIRTDGPNDLMDLITKMK